MKVVLEILILKCLLGNALTSPQDRIQKCPDSFSEEKIGDILKKTQDDKNFQFYQHAIQERTLRANDRRTDYVRYYFKKPSKTDENDSSDSSSSFDSSAEVSESLESELKSDSDNSEKSKHRYTEGDNSNSSSSEESSSESRPHEKNVDKEENSKIKSLFKKLSNLFHNKQAPSINDTREVDIEKIFRESTITKWREMEIIVKLLLIDNYKYTKKVLHIDIFNTTQTNQRQISRLEQKILQEYYLSKKDISQMVKLAKKNCKKVVKELSKKKTYEVEQLYFSQLKEQINQKIVVFKQNIKSAIDQLQIESKLTSTSDTEHSKTTDIHNVLSVKQPINHENDLPPVISIISAVNVTAEDVSKSLLTEHGKNNNDLDGAVVLNQGSNKQSKKKITFGIQPSTNTQKSSNPGQLNDSTNGIINKENKLTDFPTDAKNSSFNTGDISNTDVISKIASSAVSAGDSFLQPLGENGGNQLHDGATVRNKQHSRYFSQEISAHLVPSNIEQSNGKYNQVDNNSGIDTGLAKQKLSFSIKDELAKPKSQLSAPIYSYVTQHPRITGDIGSLKNKAPSHITDSKFEEGIVSLNTNTMQMNGYHSGSISDQVVTDYMNIRHENFANINKIMTETESEININSPLNLTETAVNDEKLESPDLPNDDFSNVENKITLTKNITTSNHITSNADFGEFNKTNQIMYVGTLRINNKSISEALGDGNIKNNSPSINQHIKTAKNNSTVKINSTINTNLTMSTTPKVIDFKTNSNIILQKNETIELTFTDPRSQQVNDPNLTEIKTNFKTVIGPMGNSNYKNNSLDSGNDGISDNEVVNDTRNSNDYHFTEIKTNYPASRQPSNNNQIIINHLQGNGDVTLNNSRKKINYQEPNERNNISAPYLIPTENKYTFNITSEEANSTYGNTLHNNKSITDTDSQRRFTEATENLRTYSANLNNNSTPQYPHTTQHPNQISLSTVIYKLKSSGNFDGQNQKHTISINATENLEREHQSVEPIDGNIENLPGQRNVDVIPHEVNAENIKNASDTNEGVEIVSTKSNSINTVNDYRVGKSIDDNNSLIEISVTAPIEQIPFELQNIKDISNKDNSGRGGENNGPIRDIITILHLNSPTPPNNIRQAYVTQHKTTNQFESETTTDNHLNNYFESTVAAINTYSTSKLSNYLLSDYNTKSTLTKNAKIISNNIPDVTETNLSENSNKNSSNSSILNQHSDKNNSFNKPFQPISEQSTKITEVDEVATTDNDDAIGSQSEKTIQIDLTAGDNHYNELPIPHNTTTIKKPQNEIIFNDPTKIIPNKTSTIDSSSYSNEEIATDSTKVSDSGYFSIDAASNLDTTTNKDSYTGLEIETVTKNESEIVNTSISTPQIDSEPTQSTLASIVTSENIVTDITTIKSTKISPVNKMNTNECKDGKGTVIDCESLILSGNIKNTNANVENKKSTVNVWPGVPDECLPLFLASDGTVLREIPSIVNISDAQTRNLCVSIAITIIQLNSSHI